MLGLDQNYLLKKVKLTKAQRNPELIETACKVVMDTMINSIIHTTENLQNQIVNIIHRPNEKWKALERYIL